MGNTSYGPTFSFAQFPVSVNANEQDADGGDGGHGGDSEATSNPFTAALGGGGDGGDSEANGGDAEVEGDGDADAEGGLAVGGEGGDGPEVDVESDAESAEGGAGGAGGAGGTNSADQTTVTTADLEFNDSFTDDDGFDAKGATIKGSFNSDDDGVDSKGGIINNSNVAGGDQDDVGNTDLDVDITDSFNVDESVTTLLNNVGNDNSTETTDITDSFNEESFEFDLELENVGNVDESIEVSDFLNELDLTGDLNIDL